MSQRICKKYTRTYTQVISKDFYSRKYQPVLPRLALNKETIIYCHKHIIFTTNTRFRKLSGES